MKSILIVLVCLVLIGCSDEERSERILRENGYTAISITGYRNFGCGEGDEYHTGFTALSPNKTTVSGVVCCGNFKGCTIRFD